MRKFATKKGPRTLFGSTEAAKYLGVSVRTLCRWRAASIASGALYGPEFMYSETGRVFYPLFSLDGFLETMTVGYSHLGRGRGKRGADKDKG